MIKELFSKLKTVNDRSEKQYWLLARKAVDAGDNATDKQLAELLELGKQFGYAKNDVENHLADIHTANDLEKELAKDPERVKAIRIARDGLKAAQAKLIETRKRLNAELAVAEKEYGEQVALAKSDEMRRGLFAAHNEALGQIKRRCPLAFN